MYISKKKWHYRLVTTVFDNIPKTLCEYFWKTIISIPYYAAICLWFWIVAIVMWPVNKFISLLQWLDDLNFTEETLAKLWRIVILLVIGISSIIFTTTVAVVMSLPNSGDTIIDIVAQIVVSLLAGVLVGGLSILGLGILICDNLTTWESADINIKYRKKKNQPKVVDNNLFWEWLKAKKQKVCPLIEYVD